MSIIKSKNAVLSRLGKPTVKSVILVAGMLLVVAPADAKGEKSPKGQLSNGYPFTQVDFTSVKITPASFWGQRLKACREVTIPLAFSKCKSEGRYENFVKAAHPSDAYDVGSFMGFPFDDTDVYKTIEGASFLLQTYPDKQLKQYIDSVLDVVAAAQEPDGYLYTARTINPKKPHPWSGATRWSQEENGSHELYNLGHMVEAACAHYRATGSRKFLDIACRYADCVVKEVGPGKDQATVMPGHQIAEMALAKLYLVTGEKKYLDEAKFLLDYRGKTKIRSSYSQSDKPILEQSEAWGHAVRAGYMYAGIADVAALTGDTAYIHAIDRIWQNIVTKKMYLTGGVGARHDGEAYGADYELPNLTAYNETCAAIAQCYLNERMFLLHGDAKYIDVLERTLYNGVIDGMSMDGGRFFYPNPLACDGKYRFNADYTITRQPWFGCACCPSNISRFIPSLPGYLYAVKDNRLFVNLYAANTATVDVNGKKVVLEQKTNYPWDGDIAITVKTCKADGLQLLVRIPGWARGEVAPGDLYQYATKADGKWFVTVNGKAVESELVNGGYVALSNVRKGDVIRVHLDMPARLVKANDRVADDRGRLAVERGPLVYCAEKVDNAADIPATYLRPDAQFEVEADKQIVNTEADGKSFGVTALTTTADALTRNADGTLAVKPTTLTLIPYYAWGHRGGDVMQVWLRSDVNE